MEELASIGSNYHAWHLILAELFLSGNVRGSLIRILYEEVHDREHHIDLASHLYIPFNISDTHLIDLNTGFSLQFSKLNPNCSYRNTANTHFPNHASCASTSTDQLYPSFSWTGTEGEETAQHDKSIVPQIFS